MSAPLELSCERLSVALLNQNSALLSIIPAGQIFVQSEEGAALKNKDRITCSALPRKPEVYGLNVGDVLVWKVLVNVTLYFAADDTAKMQMAINEIEAGMILAPGAPALVIINASGIRCQDPSEEGEFTTEDNGRKRAKTFYFLAEI